MPKFAVITGASSGIGAEFARQLSARGYNLLLVARRADRLEKLSDQLTTVCEIFTADLSKKSECLRLVKALEGRRVDLFINNAGFGDCGPFLQTELDKDLDMLSVNIRALHILTKKIGQQLYKQGFGALLNVGSCAGLMPAGPYMATYYATKALRCQPDECAGAGAARGPQPRVCRLPLPRPGQHRVQRCGERGVCAAGHYAGILRALCAGRHGPPQNGHCAEPRGCRRHDAGALPAAARVYQNRCAPAAEKAV